MPISAEEFVRRVTAAQPMAVAGLVVEGVVAIDGAAITQPDWRDCRFGASLRIHGAGVPEGLDLTGVSVGGDLRILDLDLGRKSISLRLLDVRGDVVLDGLREVHADTRVTLHRDGELDHVQDYHGLDLVGARIQGGLEISNCSGRFGSEALCLDRVAVDGLLRIGEGCTGFEYVFLTYAKLGGMLYVRLEPSTGERAGGFRLLWDGLRCAGNVSVEVGEGAFLAQLLARAGTFEGDLKVVGASAAGPESGARFAHVDLGRSTVRRNLLIRKLSGHSGGNKGWSAGAIALGECSVGLLTLAELECDTIDARGMCVEHMLDIHEVRADSIDVYALKTQDIWVRGVGPRQGALVIDFRRTSVASLAVIEETQAERLDFGFSSVGALRLESVTLGVVELLSTGVEAYLRVVGSTIRDRLSARRVSGVGEFQTRQDGGGEPSTVGVLDLGFSAWSQVDLQGLRFAGGARTGACVSAPGIAVMGRLSLRAEQFQGLPAGHVVLDIRDGQVRQLDLGKPLPGRIDFTGATIGSWGLQHEDADSYAEVLALATEFDRGAYLAIEERLENAGGRAQADRLHRIWRKREVSQLPRRRSRIIPRLHDLFLGFGTRSHRILGWWAGVTLLFAAALWLRYPLDVVVSNAYLATLQECGAACHDVLAPTLSGSRPWQFWESLQLLLRSGVPIIDLGLVPHLETRTGSTGYWLTVVIGVLGWIAWPLFLTNAATWFFPKRHRA